MTFVGKPTKFKSSTMSSELPNFGRPPIEGIEEEAEDEAEGVSVAIAAVAAEAGSEDGVVGMAEAE